jgi:hypothetical protein
MAKKAKDPGPSQADIAQVEVASARWDHYMANYRPAELELVRRSEFTAGEQAQVRGEVAADTAAAFSPLTRKTISAGSQAGHRAGSGSTKLDLAGNALAQGTAQGVGKAAATLGGRLESEMEQFRVTSIGQGKVSDVQTDLSRAARRSNTVSVHKAILKAEEQNQRVAAAATVAGAGVRKYGLVREAREVKALEDARQRNKSIFGDGVGAPRQRPYKPRADAFAPDPAYSAFYNGLLDG